MSESNLLNEDLELILSDDDIVIKYDREMNYIQIVTLLEDNELINLLINALRIVIQVDEESENFQA